MSAHHLRRPPNGRAAKPSNCTTCKKSYLKIIHEIEILKKNLDGAKDKIKMESGENSKIKNEDRNVESICSELELIRCALIDVRYAGDLRGPLKILIKNVMDIVGDTEQLSKIADVSEETKEKRIQDNIRVLRSNLTKLRAIIFQKHQPSITGYEANRDFLKTRTCSRFGDLPSLCEQGLLVHTNFYKEVKRKFEEDLVDASAAKKELEAMRMKICLLCFAIFPEDAEIGRRLLKLWWIGEDLIPDGEAPREFVDKILNKFVQMGFIEPVRKGVRPDGKAKSFKVQPLMRAALIKLAEEVRFFNFDYKGNPSAIPSVSVSDSKRICLVKNDEVEGELSLSKDVLKKMETVFNVSEQYPDLRISEDSLAKMQKLGVLYLGRWESTTKNQVEVDSTEFLKAIKDLKNLRFLSLQGMSRIATLPGFGVKLEKLRILDLRACSSLEQLPDGLSFLKSLTYLDMSECCFLKFMPKALIFLSQLKVLKGFVITERKNSCSLTELARGLKKLHKLNVRVNGAGIKVDDLKDELSQFHKLEKLKLTWGGKPLLGKSNFSNNGNLAADASTRSSSNFLSRQPPASKHREFTTLKKLELECYPLSSPPSWLVPKVLKNLKKLYIRGGNLKSLEQVPEGEEQWKVDILRFRHLNKLQMNWRQVLDLFPHLRFLERVKCPRITFCPCDAYGVWIKA